MRPDCGAVDHLQRVQITAAVGQRLQHDVPHTADAPAAELTPDRIPVAERVRQVAPRRAGAADPEHTIQHQAMVARRPPAPRRGCCQKRRDYCPLFVRHQTADHCQPPAQREVGFESHQSVSGQYPWSQTTQSESRTTCRDSFWNPSRRVRILLLTGQFWTRTAAEVKNRRSDQVCPQGLVLLCHKHLYDSATSV